MENQTARLIPSWLWAMLAVAVVVLAAVLALTDRSPEPAQAYKYDVSKYAKTETKTPRFVETNKINLDLVNPNAMALAADGRILVAGENAVAVLDADGKKTAQYAITGTPDCMAMLADGRLVLGMRNRITLLDPQGTPAGDWPLPGDKAYTTSIAASDKSVYVADAGNRVILRYDLNGALQGKIGERLPGKKDSGLVVPSPHLDVALSPTGEFWTVNPGRHGLENYRDDGELISSWYKPGMHLEGFCGCCNPVHIAFLSSGALVTAEKGLTRVKIYAPDTTLLTVVAGPERLNAVTLVPEEASFVKDLAVDAKDRVLVLHGPSRAILVFEPPPPASAPQDGKVR